VIRKIRTCTLFLFCCYQLIGQGLDNVSIRVLLNEFPEDISWVLEDEFANVITTSNFTNCEALNRCNNSFLFANEDCYRLLISDSNISDDESPIEYEVLFNGELVISSFLTDSIQTHAFGCEPGLLCESAFLQSGGNDTIVWPPVSDYWVEFVPQQTGLYQLLNCDLNTERRFPQTQMWMYEECLPRNQLGPEGAIAFSKDFSFCPPSSGFNAIPLKANQSYFIRLSLLDTINWTDSINLTITKFDDNPGCTDPNACNYYPFATADDGSCYYDNCAPDLTIDQVVFEESILFDSIQQNDVCLIREGCLTGPGKRYIIRFSTLIKNIGDSDFIIGSPEENDKGFSNDNCHQHYHQLGYAEYILYAGSGDPEPIGFKNGFCVQDSDCPDSQQRYFCNYMGITAGCEDLYGRDIPCQWVDITNVPAGDYTLVVRINWNRLSDIRGFAEKDFDNNWAQVCLRIDKSQTTPTIEILDSSCDVYRDCMGFAYGNATIDCNNVCGGTGHFADINQSGELDKEDVDEYLSNLASSGILVEPCFDLNNDGRISVYDAVLASECLRNGTADTQSHSHCLFPAGQYQELDTVRFSVTDLDTLNKMLTIGYQSPQRAIKALQLSFNGIDIRSIDQMKSNGFKDRTSDNVFLFDEINLLPRTNTVDDFLQLTYATLDENTFCIAGSEVINIENQLVFSFNRFQNDCSFLTSTTDPISELNISVFPNPAKDVVQVTSTDKLIKSIELIKSDGTIQKSWSSLRDLTLELGVGHAPKGVYFLCISVEGEQKACQKLLIQ